MHSFVAIDLELTPSSGDQQRIIEIAAARYRGGVLEDTFSTLVDPACELDPRVAALTGIRQADLTGAPTLGSVLPRFVAFVADDPIVGQSINFDLECLSRWGAGLTNEAFDTFELASMLLPGLPAYDLVTIGKSLGVEPEREHRALGDALVTARAFLAMEDRLGRLSLELLTQINALAAQIQDWPLAVLFADALRERLRHHFESTNAEPAAIQPQPGAAWPPFGPLDSLLAPRTAPTAGGTIQPEAQPATVEPTELAKLLEPGGAVASSFPNFEERPEQQKMMMAVLDAFNTGEHLLVEAGTGTGKSLAYLLPSIYYAVRNGGRVVISTNTINLQDQLYTKDLPALKECLPVSFKAALLKGRANYLCLRRWQVLSRSSNTSREELLLLIKSLLWLSTTETGDRSELNLSAADAVLWPRISAQADSCALARCPQFRRGTCFVLRARRNAESAHIVVVNHALLLSDLATSGGVLPEYAHLVVDEAHHLEEEATDQLCSNFGWSDLQFFLAGLHQIGPGHKAAGFLPELAEMIRMRPLPLDAAQGLSAAISAASAGVDAALAEGKGFFGAVSCFLHDHAEDRYRSGVRLRVTRSIRTQPGWSEVEVRWTELAGNLRSLERQLCLLDARVQTLEDGQLPERDGVVADLAGFRSYLEKMWTQVEEIVSDPSANGVYWIVGGTGLDEIAVCSAPLHVGEALNSALFGCKDSVVLTSATLTAEGSFDYIRERLSLQEGSELVLGSPFDYQRSTLLYMVQDMPEPSRPTYQRAIESAIVDLVTALEGRTLVLFTSHAQLRLTNNAVRSRLENAGILVLAHGIDGSRKRLLQAFKGSPRAVLFGTSSFWEGIDVVGDSLSCVVIVKLPFAVPTDPIIAARSEAFDEPFRQYAVPQTILKFKQGFGRLIRSDSDRGVVAILDSRLGSKFYGPAFIDSVPACTVRTGVASRLAETARDWLSVGQICPPPQSPSRP